jgi:hypothetical protein
MSGEVTGSVPLKIISAAKSYKMNVIDAKRDQALKGIVMGLFFTIILLTVIPFIIDTFVSGIIESVVGVSTLFLSSRILVNFAMWYAILKIEDLVDSDMLLERYGIYGIIGLVVAYWLAGDITDAIIPILTIIPAKFGVKF